jgi:hypothetical protein
LVDRWLGAGLTRDAIASNSTKRCAPSVSTNGQVGVGERPQPDSSRPNGPSYSEAGVALQFLDEQTAERLFEHTFIKWLEFGYKGC